jgi:NTP pyrophosphatase (non-canonical NTP hydrolase)
MTTPKAPTAHPLGEAAGSALTRDQIAHAITCELDRAYSKHGREQWGRHEFYAILKEEVDELWDAIKTDAPQGEVRKEAIQVASMVFRYLETADRYREPNS